jgi:predicted metal-dependent HD superfamily phosphohydrolase
LHFTDYPFAPASVFPSGDIEVGHIREINLGYPPQVRLASGEVLFVSQTEKDALVAFINEHDVPMRRRLSVWGALLDPFLDTWEDQETIDRQFAWFAGLGLDRETVDRWRHEVAVAMVAYNFGTGLWEWVSLDLYDALIAQRARLSRAAFADFYSRAMQLTRLDPLAPEWSSSTNRDIASTLTSVLEDWYPRDEGIALKNLTKKWEDRRDAIERLKQPLLAELTAAYSEPHRHYHTQTHIEACLTELEQASAYAVHHNEIRWALLFHDAVYDTHRHDNEIRSADWACRVMAELGRPEDEQARVRGMILATGHSDGPRTADEALLLDADLSLLGADEATFDAYDRSIRAEYEWVPEQRYEQARAKVLQAFLDRPRVYYTAHFRQRYEVAARANLQRAIARLQGA